MKSSVQSLLTQAFVFQEGETPLHCAAARGNLDCVRVLIDNSAPINATDRVRDIQEPSLELTVVIKRDGVAGGTCSN